jgi:DNA-directed RNA polymerase specialized sigma24 family protein
MTPMPAMPFRPSCLRTALNAEWARLVEDVEPVPFDWQRSGPELAGCSDLQGVLTRIGEEPDPTLHTLLALCAAGDLLAGRVVLQAMLGKLVRTAAGDSEAGLDDYVSAAWLRIRTYPLGDRPTRIAANLALDTLKMVQKQVRAPLGIDVTPYPPSAFVDALWSPAEPDDDELAARRIIHAAATLGLISEDTRAVLISVYADGLTGASAATRHGKSPGAIRVQCHKAVRTLARHAHLLAEAV